MSCIGTVCLLAAQLTNGDIGYHNNMPDTASSYDGKPRDISRFYKDKQFNVHLEGYIVLNTNTRINLGYNNGYNTDKMHMSDMYSLGVTQLIKINKENYLTVSGSIRSGNKVTHTPCTDSYGREYYCANLTAWSDFKGQAYANTYKANITWTHKF